MFFVYISSIFSGKRYGHFKQIFLFVRIFIATNKYLLEFAIFKFVLNLIVCNQLSKFKKKTRHEICIRLIKKCLHSV